jgi:hypothetical protein
MVPDRPFEELVLFVDLLDFGVGSNQRIERRIEPLHHVLRVRGANPKPVAAKRTMANFFMTTNLPYAAHSAPLACLHSSTQDR